MSGRAMQELAVPLTQRLVPFSGGPAGVAIEAGALVWRQGPAQARLQLAFRVQGAGALLLPPASPAPQRRDGLWQHTCLEAFLAPVNAEPYWEVNLSPSGDWNVYRLESYRQGLRPEPSVEALPFSCRLQPPHTSAAVELAPGSPEPSTLELELELSCPLPPELAAAPKLAVGLSAVLESPGGVISYWALHHPRPEADFHARRGWTLRL